MPAKIIIFSERDLWDSLAGALKQKNPKLKIAFAEKLETLEALCQNQEPKTSSCRLISYCSNVVIPSSLLGQLGAGAYNFHPGPPTYPGAHPASFSIYDGAKNFGVTAHVMEANIDTGAIVGVKWFEIEPRLNFVQLEFRAIQYLIQLFMELSGPLANQNEPLKQIGVNWSGPK